MLIIPAIDIQDGCVVRFVQGKLDKKIYSRDPLKTAVHWVRQGAGLIHVVDLDGAISGVPKNLEIVKSIASKSGAAVQCGGGIRTQDTMRALLDAGVSRVIVGTKAVKDKQFLQDVLKIFKEQVVVSIDAKNGQVLVDGWQEDSSSVDVVTFAQGLKDMGFTEAIYTDIGKDGTLKGPNIAETQRLLKTGLRLIASGGVSSTEDIQKLKNLQKEGLIGVIIGKALYEGKFTLSQALQLS